MSTEQYGIHAIRAGEAVIIHNGVEVAGLRSPVADVHFDHSPTQDDLVQIAEKRIQFAYLEDRLTRCLRLCADFTDEELRDLDGATFKSAIGKAMLAAQLTASPPSP